MSHGHTHTVSEQIRILEHVWFCDDISARMKEDELH